jgi:thiamine-monophosphate kinase
MPLSEFELIDRYFRRPAPHAVLGIGDDAALVAPTAGCELAVSVDMLIEGTHFFPDVDPGALGHKTLAVNLSDLAAMGARPRWALLACALLEIDPSWLEAFARGFFALADAYDVELIGGDTTRGPLSLCVTILGEAPAGKALRRSGARPGDSIYVSGRLGDAALALAHHRGRIALAADEFAQCEHALLRPTPRVALGERLRGLASSAIDISDGLTGDLGHILEASSVGATVELASLPRSPALDRRLSGAERSLALECLLAGGDDYELCFTAPASAETPLQDLSRELALPLARIGRIDQSRELILRDERGQTLPTPPRAFDHFRG